MGITEKVLPAPEVPAPLWKPSDKEQGRVDGFCAMGKNYIAGGNFQAVSPVGGPTTKTPWFVVFDQAGRVVTTKGSPRGRVYGCSATGQIFYLAGRGGLDKSNAGTWTHMLDGTFRDVRVLGNRVLASTENGQVMLLEDKKPVWVVKLAGSVRRICPSPTGEIFAALWQSNHSGSVAKLSKDGKVVTSFRADVHLPAIDMAISGNGSNLFIAEGGPGGTALCLDAKTGKRKWFYATDGNCQAIATTGGEVAVGMHGDYVAPQANATMKEYGSSKRIERKKLFVLDAGTGKLGDFSVPLSSSASPLGVWSLEALQGRLLVGGDFTKPRARMIAFEIT